MVILSDEARQYQADFIKQVTGDMKGCWGSLKKPLRLDVVVYYSSNRSDLSIELLKDLLQKAKVVKNDNYIREEHVYGFLDRENPRVELRLWTLEKREKPFSLT